MPLNLWCFIFHDTPRVERFEIWKRLRSAEPYSRLHTHIPSNTDRWEQLRQITFTYLCMNVQLQLHFRARRTSFWHATSNCQSKLENSAEVFHMLEQHLVRGRNFLWSIICWLSFFFSMALTQIVIHLYYSPPWTTVCMEQMEKTKEAP